MFLANVLYDEESDSNPAVHNVAVIPGTTLVFGVESGGAGKTNDLVDVSNPDNPVVGRLYVDTIQNAARKQREISEGILEQMQELKNTASPKRPRRGRRRGIISPA